MTELENDSVASTIKSPPYWNAIENDIHTTGKSKHYRTRSYAEGCKNYEEYLDWLVEVYNEVFRVTKLGVFCDIINETVLLEG